MTAYNRKALTILSACGIALCIGGSFYPPVQKWAWLSGFVGVFALMVLLLGIMLSRQEKKYGKKAGRYQSAMPDNARQALRILRNQDDGSHHYRQVPPEQLQKSIFGGKNEP